MKAVFKKIVLFCPSMLVLIFAMGCTSEDNTNSSDSPSKMAFAVPSKISALQINPDSLRAYLIVDGGQRQTMTISEDGLSAQASVKLKVGVHTFKIEFDYDYIVGTTAKTAMLADASLSLDVKKGNNSLSFSDDDFSYDHHCDNDDATNILEISKGSDPCDVSSKPDVVPPITTVNPEGGSYFGFVTVALSCTDSGGDATASGCEATYYTLDGTTPTATSPQYSAPIVLTQDATLTFQSVDIAHNSESVRSFDFMVTPAPDVGGVWWMKNSPAKPDPVYTNTLCSLGSFNPRISVVQDIISLTATDDTGVQYTGTLDDGNGNFTLNGSKSWSDANNDTVTISVEITGQFNTSDNITASMTRSASIAEAPNTCSETSDLAGAITFQHTGQDYTGLYGGEIINVSMYDPGEFGQNAALLEFDIQDTNASMYIPETGAAYTGTYDMNTGAFSLTLTNDYFVDDDNDGLRNDLVHQTQMVDGLFVESPDSSLASLVGLYNGYRAIFHNTPVYNPALTPDRTGQDAGRFYGKQVLASTTTQTVLLPETGLGPESVSFYKLVLNNPPLKRLNPDSLLAIEVVDPDNNPICGILYQDRLIQITNLPHVDFKTEQFQGDIYSSVHCYVASDVTLNTASDFYTVNIVDGTTVVDSYPLTATPAPILNVRPDHHAINVNGMVASQTRAADPLPLSGYFNLYEDLLMTWPQTGNFVAGLTLQDYELQMIRQGEPMREYRYASLSNSVTLPQNELLTRAMRENNIAELRLVENFATLGGAEAQAVSRGLEVHPGFRGLFNIELVDSLGSSIIGQLFMNTTNSDFSTAQCGVTRIYDTAVTCDGQADLANNQITATLVNTSTSEVFTLTADFIDSATADIVMSSGTESASGQGKFVNTEVKSRSILFSDGTQITGVDIKNTGPFFNRGRLTSASGQNLGNGNGNPITLWNDNYADVYSSYEVLPIDGLEPQTLMTNVAYRSGFPLNADTFTVELRNTSQPNYDENYSISYQAPDSTVLFEPGLFPPSRTQFAINGVALTGDLGTSTDPYFLVEGNPIAIAWSDTTSISMRNDLRWQVQIRSTTNPHEERRSRQLSASEFNFSGGTIEWMAPPNFTANLLTSSPADATITVRIRDVANTMRGAADRVYVTLLAAGSNAPPIAINDAASMSPGGTINISVLANDVDPESDALTVTIDTAPNNGTVVVEIDGSVIYTPNPGFSGSDSFIYQIRDTSDNTDTATVNISVV